MATSETGRREDALLSKKEAAEWLSVPVRMIRRLVEQQILEPARIENSMLWFRQEDVANAARSLKRGVSLTSVSHHAIQALAIAQRAERKIDDIMTTLGARYEPLSMEAADVEDLFNRFEDLRREETAALTADQVRGWAKIFFGMNRAYFMLVEVLTGSQEAWKIPLDTATTVLEHAPTEYFDRQPDLFLAYTLLESSRQSLRQEAYFYCRERYGTRVAERTFPERSGKDVNDLILQLLRS